MSVANLRLTVVTGYDGAYRNIAEASIPNKEAYCNAYGFDLRVYEHEAFDGRASQWSKIVWLSQSVATGDWLFWSDADSLICDKNISLMKWLEHVPDYINLIISDDLPWLTYPPGTFGANTGNFFLRCCEWSDILLTEVWHDCSEEFRQGPFHEQSVMTDLINSRSWVKRHTHLVPMRDFNSLPSVFTPGDFVNHFAGLPDKGVQMREFLKTCDKSSLPWPVSS